MRRRDLLAGLLATTAASAVRADDARKVHRIAVCWVFLDLSRPIWIRFFDELRRLGYLEATNLVVDRYDASKPDRYPQVVRDILQSKPDLIVVGFSHELIIQLGKATSSIPIVAVMGDPVASGIVTNLARPDANITGIALDAGVEMHGKHLELLREAVPSASRVAYLAPRPQWEGAYGRVVVKVGKQLGISIIGMPMEESAEEPQYVQAFESMAEQRAEAVEVNGFGTNITYRQLIADLALKYRLPSIYWQGDVVEMGGLMVYYSNYEDLFVRMADQVDQVLKGGKPGDIPIQQPTKFSLAINLKTAKALGLTIPTSLLAQADRVIE